MELGDLHRNQPIVSVNDPVVRRCSRAGPRRRTSSSVTSTQRCMPQPFSPLGSTTPIRRCLTPWVSSSVTLLVMTSRPR